MFRFVDNLILRVSFYLLVIAFFIGVFVKVTTVPATQAALQAGFTTEENSLPESSAEDIGYAVAMDAEGNVFIAGTSNTQWGAPVNRHSGGGGDCFIAKLNDKGVLQWNTFLGGARYDGCRALSLDGKGNVYLTGESSSTWAVPVNAFGGGSYDCFVAKLDNNGVLQWNTFLGGALYDGGHAIAVDRSGNVFVAGNSSETWASPITSHREGNHDGFAAKLDKNGMLQWNTFLGGDNYDGGYAIAVDGYGNVYMAGESSSKWGSPVNDFIQGYYGDYDAYVAKLGPNGALQWNTFMGGIGSDYGRGIAIDEKGYIYLIGNSNVTWGQPVTSHNRDCDAFAAKLDENGALQWNTFLGGKGADYSRAITVNWTGNIFLTGQSSSSWGKPVNPFGGEGDAVAIKLNGNGVLQWNTFLGGAGSDFGRGISMDGIGNIYLTGESSSSWGTPGNKFQGEINAFVAKLSNAGALRWNTFMGGR